VRKILIVDDDRDVVDLLRTALFSAGFLTRTAASGQEALKKVRLTRPDLVVLDILMPGPNGLAVCEALRRDRMTAHIPIILLTGLPGELPRFAGAEAGADSYMRKPFKVEEVIERIHQLLPPESAEEKAAAFAIAAAPIANTAPALPAPS
jgi:DNA-binding response OmpR family regulator